MLSLTGMFAFSIGILGQIGNLILIWLNKLIDDINKNFLV
jgi:hypothetical protein